MLLSNVETKKQKKKKLTVWSLERWNETTKENFGFNHPTPQTPFWNRKTPEPERASREVLRKAEKSRKGVARGAAINNEVR